MTVRLCLTSGAFVLQGLDAQVDAILAALAARGLDAVVESRGLCG